MDSHMEYQTHKNKYTLLRNEILRRNLATTSINTNFPQTLRPVKAPTKSTPVQKPEKMYAVSNILKKKNDYAVDWMGAHNHRLIGFDNEEKGIKLNFIDYTTIHGRGRDQIFLKNIESSEYGEVKSVLANDDMQHIIDESRLFINTHVSGIKDNESIILKFNITETIKNNMRGGSANYDINCLSKGANKYIPSNWTIIYTTPEYNCINMSMLATMLIHKHEADSRTDAKLANGSVKYNLDHVIGQYILERRALNSFIEMELKNPHATIATKLNFIYDKISTDVKLNSLDSQSISTGTGKTDFDTMIISFAKMNLMYAQVEHYLANDIRIDVISEKPYACVSQFTDYFKSLPLQPSDADIMQLIFDKYDTITLLALPILRAYKPTFDDLQNGNYIIKLETAHLLRPDNKDVHNGISTDRDIKRLMWILNGSLDSKILLRCKNQINLIHSYLHQMDGAIFHEFPAAQQRHESEANETINKIGDIYTRYCFELLANVNRYHFLDKDANGHFILDTNKYTQNDSKILNSKKRQLDTSKEPLDKMRTMVAQIDFKGMPTTPLYPVNDPLTRKIMTMNEPQNNKKFSVINDYFTRYNTSSTLKAINPSLVYAYIKNIMRVYGTLNAPLQEITIQDVFIYFAYNRDPDRYAIAFAPITLPPALSETFIPTPPPPTRLDISF